MFSISQAHTLYFHTENNHLHFYTIIEITMEMTLRLSAASLDNCLVIIQTFLVCLLWHAFEVTALLDLGFPYKTLVSVTFLRRLIRITLICIIILLSYEDVHGFTIRMYLLGRTGCVKRETDGCRILPVKYIKAYPLPMAGGLGCWPF